MGSSTLLPTDRFLGESRAVSPSQVPDRGRCTVSLARLAVPLDRHCEASRSFPACIEDTESSSPVHLATMRGSKRCQDDRKPTEKIYPCYALELGSRCTRLQRAWVERWGCLG